MSYLIFIVLGYFLIAGGNILAGLCLYDNFSGDPKAGLASVMLFVPVMAACFCGFLLCRIGGHLPLSLVYMLPAFCVLDGTRKLL